MTPQKNYLAYSPSARLASIVQRYEILNLDKQSSGQTMIFLPGFDCGLLFLFYENKSPLRIESEVLERVTIPKCTLVPTLSVPNYNFIGDFLRGIRVIFQPGIFHCLYNVPLAPFVDRMVELDYVVDKRLSDLQERLMATDSIQQRLTYIEQYLLQRLRFANTPKLLFPKLNQYLSSINYPSTVKDFAKIAYKSDRQFNRILKKEVGLNASTFIRIQRFNLILHHFQKHSDKSLSQMAIDFGYTDQSHFTREFKKLSGQTPGEYRKSIKKGKLLDNHFEENTAHGGVAINALV